MGVFGWSAVGGLIGEGPAVVILVVGEVDGRKVGGGGKMGVWVFREVRDGGGVVESGVRPKGKMRGKGGKMT
jgi:hypothetical protein